jgi:phosphatidylinositol glycan class C protein
VEDEEVGVGSKKHTNAGVASTNFAMISALLVCSRMPEHAYVFELLLLSMFLFAFLPYLRREMLAYSKELYIGFMFAGTIFNAFVIWFLSPWISVLYFLAIMFLKYLVPFILVSVHSYKNEIAGPWDLPKVQNYSAPN